MGCSSERWTACSTYGNVCSVKKNIFGIQYLRAYAALLVVFNHLWSTGGVISKYLGFDIIGGFGVDIFFVISGFIMAYTISDYSKPERFGIGWSFIKKRIHRIYPLHVLVLAPMILVYILGCILKKDEVSIYSIIGSVFLLPDFTASSSYRMINPVEWTLVYEMIFYISLSAFIFITPGKKSCLIIYSIFLALVVLIINGFGFRGERLEWVNIKYIVGDTIFLDFIMGFFVYYLSKKIKIKLTAIQTMSLILVLTALAVIMAKAGLPRLVSYGCPAFILVLIFTVEEKLNREKINLLMTLGGASYAIYLTHPLYLKAYSAIHHLKPSVGEGSDLINFFISLAAIITGLLTYKYIEPWLNKITRPKI